MSLFDRMVLNMSDRMTEFDEATQRYQRGERNLGEQSLMGAATFLGGALDVPGEVLGSVMPDWMKEGMESIMRGALNTAPAQAYMEWRDANPRQAENVERGLAVGTELAGGLMSRGMPKTTLDAIAENAPNKLEGFYGSGRVGQLGSVVAGVPSTVAYTVEELMSPKAQARSRGGVSPRLRSVAKNEEDLSFVEGQLDQSSLLRTGGNRPMPMLDDTFNRAQVLHRGDLGPDGVRQSFETYKPEQYKGLNVDDELIDTITNNIYKDWGIAPGANAKIVVRHPTNLTDLYPESTARGSNTAKRMFKARSVLMKYFPDKTELSPEEMLEFVATKNLVDSRPVRVDGKPMTEADRRYVELFGMGERYKPSESGLKNIDDYYKYKKMEADGEKFMKSQREKYDMLKARIGRGTANIEFDSQGRMHFSDSHRSAAKGLGGVGDRFVVTPDGKVMHYMTDENDLMGFKVPGDAHVITMTPPTVYDILKLSGKSKPDVKSKQAKEQLTADMAERYGSTPRGTGRDPLRAQIAESVANYSPDVTLGDLAVPARTTGMLSLGMGAASQYGNEEQ